MDDSISKGKIFIACLVLAFLVGVVGIIASFEIISAGHRGIIVTLGEVQDTVLDEGFHWVSPLADVKEIDVKTQKVEATATAASKDLQTVTAVVAVNYHLDSKAVNHLFQEVGMDYDSKIIAPAIQEAVKAAASQFTAEELVTKRGEVADKIKLSLIDRLAKSYIVMENVSIVNFEFSKGFDQAIEKKVTAEQNALASKNKLEQVKYEAEQRIVQAKAEAEAIRIQAESVSQSGGAAYVDLKWVEKWNGALPTTMLGDDTALIMNK